MSPSNNIVIDEKLLDSYKDLTKKVKDVKVELVTTAGNVVHCIHCLLDQLRVPNRNSSNLLFVNLPFLKTQNG